MKRQLILLLLILLTMAACLNLGGQDDILQTDEDDNIEVSILPSDSLSDSQYKMLLPFKPSAARGTITNQVNNRVDMDELEDGLRRLSTDVFDPEKYVYEDGQYFTTKHIIGDKNEEGLIDKLNPKIKEKEDDDEQVKEHKENPRVFSHILEQNYLERKDDTVKLAGVSIAISLKSVYRFQIETGGDYYYKDISEKEMLEAGKEIAEVILEEARSIEGLGDVPIMIALFREEKQSSPVSGNFVAKTFVDRGERTIGKWEPIDEEYLLLTSSKAKNKHADDYQKVKAFSDKVAEYFPNFNAVVAEGFYVDDELRRVKLEIPIEFYGRSEVVGFTQHVYGLLNEIFSNYYDIELTVTSSERVESIIYRPAGEEEANVYIFH